jgi:hypothetical protein
MLDVTQAHVQNTWPHESPLLAARLDLKNRFAFATAEDGKVQRFALADGKKTVFGGHESWIFSLCLSRDGETLYTGGGDGKLAFYPAAAETPVAARVIEAHQGWIRCMTLSPDGSQLATGGNDKAVRIWNTATGEKVREFVEHETPVYSLLWHPSEPTLLSGDLRGVVKQWDLAQAKLARTFDAKLLHSFNGGQRVDFGGVRSMALSADGKTLSCGGLHKSENPLGAVLEPLVLQFEWDTQKLARQQIAEGLKGPLWRIQYLSDGTLLGVMGGSGGGWLLFWKPTEEKAFHRFQLPALARDGDLSSDGLLVLTSHSDKQLRISKLAAKA